MKKLLSLFVSVLFIFSTACIPAPARAQAMFTDMMDTVSTDTMHHTAVKTSADMTADARSPGDDWLLWILVLLIVGILCIVLFKSRKKKMTPATYHQTTSLSDGDENEITPIEAKGLYVDTKVRRK